VDRVVLDIVALQARVPAIGASFGSAIEHWRRQLGLAYASGPLLGGAVHAL